MRPVRAASSTPTFPNTRENYMLVSKKRDSETERETERDVKDLGQHHTLSLNTLATFVIAPLDVELFPMASSTCVNDDI